MPRKYSSEEIRQDDLDKQSLVNQESIENAITGKEKADALRESLAIEIDAGYVEQAAKLTQELHRKQIEGAKTKDIKEIHKKLLN